MKKGPLSNEEKQYIRDNAKNFETIEGLASDMDRGVAIVTKFLSSVSKDQKQNVSELFARKEDRGVTVMTEAASIASDENKKNKQIQSPPRYNKFIHKIKE